jgi:hypothetical protein
VNTDARTIENVETPNFEFDNPSTLSDVTRSIVINSLEVTNDSPVVGDITTPSVEELKIHSLNAYPTQNRAVTKEDYVAMIYRMPKKFGAVKRTNIIQDPDSFKRNLNLYIISESAQQTLTESPMRLKQNLKTWISQHKMINDTVDILDAKILNLEINFSILSSLSFDKFDVLQSAQAELVDFFSILPEIGEPFYITDVFTAMKDVIGVVDVIDVRIKTKTGGSYSNFVYDVDRNTSADGRRISIPENCIWEVKFKDTDIRGEIL